MIKKYTLLSIFFTCLIGQGVSSVDIQNLSNEDLDLIRETLVSPDTESIDSVVETVETVETEEPVEIDVKENEDLYFGYEYFKREISFFDNIPTPPDFKLGPGDEIVLSLWGETNSRTNFVINKEGLIYYENIGFINLSNQTLKEAELILQKELSRIYSTLKDKENSTQLMLELGKLKSINVYFSGQIENPGINLIHPFSDVFSAIVQVGGVKTAGSLRNVQLIRKGKIISTIDFYSFFTDGKNNFSTIRILDGDVIHIPIVSKRVKIEGSVNNPRYFELLDDESLADLIQYAGNLEANASSKITLEILIPIQERSSDDNARLSTVVNIDTVSNTELNNGDIVIVGSINDVITKVEIFGRVKSPGLYPATLNLKEVLDMAGGFNDPIYRQSIRDDSILILRKDRNQFYGLEFDISYNKSDGFKLLAGDKIFVYEDYKYENSFSITVKGSVKKRGSYPFKPGMTISDAINLSEGFTELADENGISVMQEFFSLDEEGNEFLEYKSVNNVSSEFQLSNNSVVTVSRIENVVNVQGNVYNPGLISYDRKHNVRNYIERSGGLKENSLIKDITLQRANGRIINIKRINGLFISPKPGDRIFVPENPNPPADFNVTAFTANILTILTNLVAILAIVDNNSD